MSTIRKFLFRFIRDQDGQAVAETALCLPLVLFILLGVIEYGYLPYARTVVIDSAREAARAEALSLGSGTEKAEEVMEDGGLDKNNAVILRSDDGVFVEYSVTYNHPAMVPGLPLLIGMDQSDTYTLKAASIFKIEK